MDSDRLIERIRKLNTEIMILTLQYHKFMDENFFNYDEAIDKETDRQVEEIEQKVLEIYELCYELHGVLGGSLQDTLDTIEDYGSDVIFAMEDPDMDFEDLILEDNIN